MLSGTKNGPTCGKGTTHLHLMSHPNNIDQERYFNDPEYRKQIAKELINGQHPTVDYDRPLLWLVVHSF